MMNNNKSFKRWTIFVIIITLLSILITILSGLIKILFIVVLAVVFISSFMGYLEKKFPNSKLAKSINKLLSWVK